MSGAVPHTDRVVAALELRRGLPRDRHVREHLGRVEDAAVRGLVEELQRGEGVVAEPDAVGEVDGGGEERCAFQGDVRQVRDGAAGKGGFLLVGGVCRDGGGDLVDGVEGQALRTARLLD